MPLHPESSVPDDRFTYIYRCRNRKCKRFKKDVVLHHDPIAFLEKHGTFLVCEGCTQPLTHHRTKYPRSFKQVFARYNPNIQLGEPGDYLPSIIKRASEIVDESSSKRS